MGFYEADERGCIYPLSPLACGCAPCGGEVVYATSHEAAFSLYQRYRGGEASLKRTLWLQGDVFPNVIHETAFFPEVFQ